MDGKTLFKLLLAAILLNLLQVQKHILLFSMKRNVRLGSFLDPKFNHACRAKEVASTVIQLRSV